MALITNFDDVFLKDLPKIPKSGEFYLKTSEIVDIDYARIRATDIHINQLIRFNEISKAWVYEQLGVPKEIDHG